MTPWVLVVWALAIVLLGLGLAFAAVTIVATIIELRKMWQKADLERRAKARGQEPLRNLHEDAPEED